MGSGAYQNHLNSFLTAQRQLTRPRPLSGHPYRLPCDTKILAILGYFQHFKMQNQVSKKYFLGKIPFSPVLYVWNTKEKRSAQKITYKINFSPLPNVHLISFWLLADFWLISSWFTSYIWLILSWFTLLVFPTYFKDFHRVF